MSSGNDNHTSFSIPGNDKFCPFGGHSKTSTTTVASSSVVVNIEECIATEIVGQNEPQPPSANNEKSGQKKRSAAQIDGSQRLDEPAKKVKPTTARYGDTAGNPASPSNILGETASDGPLNRSQDLIARRRRTNRSRRVANNQGKHEPYTRPGTKFRWSDNGHIDTTQSKTGPADKSRYQLVLKDTNGNWVKYHYTRHKEIDWSNNKDIAHLNTWRNQIIKRKLKNDNGTSQQNEHRLHWSEKEKISVKSLIRDQIRKKHRHLASSDWIAIAEKYNTRFRGVTVHVGEKLPAALTNKGQLADSKVLKKAYVLADRTFSAIRSQASRWPDTVEMVKEELRKLGIVKANGDGGEDSQGDGEGEGEEDEENEEGGDGGGEVDLDLEDPSSDEDEGRRPTSTQNSARSIPAAA